MHVRYFSEEVILNEERTTEEERMHIMNGKLGGSTMLTQHLNENIISKLLFPTFHLVRKRLAAKKRKLKTNEKSKSTDTEDESTYDYCQDDGMTDFRSQNMKNLK